MADLIELIPLVSGRSRVEPLRRYGSLPLLELEAAKEILGEVFDAHPGEVEDMIRRRLLELQEERPFFGGGSRPS